MIRTRARKIIRDVLARKGRTLLVSTAIFIGVAGTIALFSLSDIIVSQLREDIKESELSMLDIFVTVNTGTELDNESYLERLRELPGVTEVMGSIQNTGYFKVSEEDEFDDGIINAYSYPYSERLPIIPMRLIEGEYPVDGANEVAIEKRTAEEYNLKVGDSVYFRILSPSKDTQEIGTTEAWTVTGIVFHPYTFSPKVSFYTSLSDGNYITGTTGYSVFSARFVDYGTAEDEKENIANIIADETPYIPVFVQSEDPANNSLIQGAQQISGTMGFLAIVALIVSGFLVINVISSIVVEQKRQIGVMKSMGATRFDNFFMYAGIAFAYGVIGVIPGVIVGIPGGNAAAHALAPQLNTSLEGFKSSPGAIILGILVGLLVPVFASLIPVFFGTRVKILEAMTDLGIDANYGSGPVAKLIGLLPIPITVRQGLSNVSIKKSRVAFTVVTLAIAAGAFMGIFAVFDSITSGLNIFLDSFNVEVGVFPTEGRDPAQVVPIIEQHFLAVENPIIESIEPGFQLQVEFEGYDPPLAAGGPPGIFAYGYDVESETPAFKFTVDEGEKLNPDNAADGIILSSSLALGMDRKVGDTVVMKVPGNTAELQVVGISDYPIDQVWLDWQTLATISGYVTGAPRPNEYQTQVAVTDYEGTLSNGQVITLGMDTQISSFLQFSEGEFFTPGEPGVIISQEMADNGGYAVGDMLSVTAANGTTREYPIAGIFTLPDIARQQMGDIPADVMGMDYQELAALEGLSTEGGVPIPQGYFLTTTLDDPTIKELDDISDDLNEVMLNQGIPVQIFNFVELVEQISQALFTIQAILSAVAGLIALIGALGLLTTLSMSVFERQKEIGVMRSIGASSSIVSIQFLTEGLVVGFIAWLVGLPLAVLFEYGLLQATQLSDTFPMSYPIAAALIGLIGVMVITTIASLWPSIAASRKTVSDILRYQ